MFCKRCGVEISAYSQGLYCSKCSDMHAQNIIPITVESIITAAAKEIDRRNSELPCIENQIAIQMLEAALYWLNERTRKRKEQQVEGTNKPHHS